MSKTAEKISCELQELLDENPGQTLLESIKWYFKGRLKMIASHGKNS